jgi:hypothetical protein
MLVCQSVPKLLISDPGSVCEMPSPPEDGLCAGPESTRELRARADRTGHGSGWVGSFSTCRKARASRRATSIERNPRRASTMIIAKSRTPIGDRSPILAGLDIQLNAPMVGLVHNVIEG